MIHSTGIEKDWKAHNNIKQSKITLNIRSFDYRELLQRLIETALWKLNKGTSLVLGDPTPISGLKSTRTTSYLDISCRYTGNPERTIDLGRIVYIG
jgi:hypothetical protein